MPDIRIDTSSLAVTSFQITELGADTFDGKDVVTVSLPAGAYHFHQAHGADATFPFSVAADGTVDFEPGHSGYLDGRGTTTLTVTGYPILIDGRTLPNDLALDGFPAGAPMLTRDQPHVLGLLPLDTLYTLQSQPQPGPAYRFGIHPDGTVSALDPGPLVSAAGAGIPTRSPSPVSALRRAADRAEIEFDRLDALVNTSSALAARYTPARDAARGALDAARAAVMQAVGQEPRMWSDGSTVPALLTPVRLEVRYLPNEQRPNAAAALAIRVLPDDIAVHSFEPELTDNEREAAAAYWTAAAAPTATADDRTAAWTTILGRLGASRAAWAVEAMRPEIDAGGVPRFPEVARRESTWTRPATSLLLPDRFVFRGWRGGQLVFETTGADIPAGLAIGPDPTDLAGPSAELGWSKTSAWMVDYDEAVRVGMAVTVPLTGPDPTFDEIFVLGVSDRGSDVAATHLAQSLQGHLYTRGLAFPPYDAPTNNTPATRSEWTTAPVMRTPEQVQDAIATEVAGSGQPGVRLADAFGYGPVGPSALPGRRDLLAANGGTDRDDELTARDSVAADGAGPTKVGDAADAANLGWLNAQETGDFFTEFVRPRGPLPSLRIGRQPYGILPVTSLALWSPADSEPVPADVLTRLRLLHGFIGRHLPLSPRVGRGPDQDDVLLGLLRRVPCSIGFRGCEVDLDTADTGVGEPNLMVGTFPQLRSRISGFTKLADRGTTLVDAKGIASSAAKWLTDYTALLATAHTPAEVDALGRPPAFPDWFTWITQTFSQNDALSNIGLYWAQVIGVAGSGLFSGFLLMAAIRKVELDPDPKPEDLAEANKYRDFFTTLLPSYLDALAKFESLAETDQGAVDRHIASVTEALTFRIDAWATALATARLRTVRASAPTGIRLGSYGWLVDVEPTAPGMRKSETGWVMTPSMQHAATAAVLHSGWAGHSQPQAYAVDLTSERVRRAQATLSALREGRTLEELLGYQLERGLHDAQADDLIAPLRDTFPLPPADTGLSADPQATASARAEQGRRLVVDGDAARHGGASFIAAHAKLTAQQTQLLSSLFAQLDDTVDAMGDVLLAEGVHQLVSGSPLRAGLAADTVGRANPVPDRLDVLNTPRSQVAVNHTVAIAVACDEADGWPTSPRSTLDPSGETLAAWALGKPGDWQVTITGPAGAPDISTLADLDAAAIDVVVEATADTDSSALAARIRRHRNADGTVRITRTDGLGDDAALPALTGAIRALLVASRPSATPTSALVPLSAGVAADLTELATRVRTWWTSVTTALATWPEGSPQDQQDAMTMLAHLGLSGVRFDTPAAAGAALQQRWTGITLPPSPPPANDSDAASWLSTVRDAASQAIGNWFVAAPFWTAGPEGWAVLGGEEPTSPPSGDDVEDWLATHREVRDGVTRLTDVLLASGSVGGGIPTWIVRQRQASTDASPLAGWLGRTHPGTRSADHLAALQIGPPVGTPHTLLVVDQWIEAVPVAPRGDAAVPDHNAALGFRFDRPDARAPQAVLVVAPPDLGRGWCLEDLHAAVEETLWWTRARPLDFEDLPELRWVLA